MPFVDEPDVDEPDEEAGPSWCFGCEREIDPMVCGCGDAKWLHVSSVDDGHSFVPMGCNCYREPSMPTREPTHDWLKMGNQ